MLKFERKDLLYVPWSDDEALLGEAWGIISNTEVSVKNHLYDDDMFARQMRSTGYWRRLWVLSHGGVGSRRIYSSNGHYLTPKQLARHLKSKGMQPGSVKEVFVFACYAGKYGGFAQALWSYLRRGYPDLRVSGFRGITGSVQPRALGGYLNYMRPAELEMNRIDRSYPAITKEMLTVYPEAKVYSYDI